MSTRFRDPLGSQPYVDPAAAPDSVPKVDEIGVTSGPLKSAAFFIGKFCQAYNDDFMQCKAENRDPAHCLKEGRRVTRCATELLSKLREHCEPEWNKHWDCLENRNHEFYRCRQAETALNNCVLAKLGIPKTIPDAKYQVHQLKSPMYKDDTPRADRP